MLTYIISTKFLTTPYLTQTPSWSYHILISKIKSQLQYHTFTKIEIFNKGKNDKLRFQQLDKMVLQSSSSPYTAIIVTDASIKNDIATSILHIHLVDHPLTKTVHHAAFVTSTEAELFAIRCSINQACNKENVSKIIIVTNSIYTVKKIFDSKSHSYQIHTMAILSELHCFFAISQENSIEF